MAGVNINRVIITGNLTRDPELRSTNGGLSICKLGIAVNGRRKNGSTGEWEDKANFFRVTVFGTQADRCHEYLRKGRPVAIDGRLEWSQYERDGQKIESVDIIADTVQFLGGRDDVGNGNGNGFASSVRAAEGDVPIDSADFQPVGASSGAADDDIPF